MSLINRYIARQVAGAIAVVLLVIVSLDALAAFIDQLDDLEAHFDLVEALIYTLLGVPASLYEYLPLACLVGCLVGLGTLASNSELTVMRSAGISIRQLIKAVMVPVLMAVGLAVAMGEWVTPTIDQYAESRKAIALGQRAALQGQRGVWNREGNEYMHFSAVLPGGRLMGITRFTFDDQQQLQRTTSVREAVYDEGLWRESGVVITILNKTEVHQEVLATREWRADITPRLLGLLVLTPDNLPMHRLFSYARYLKRQGQGAAEYWLGFWQKALQPLAILSLVMIAISFIFGPLRQVTLGFRIFTGVLVGIIFQTAQELLGPSSLLYGFPPLLAVLVPILISAGVGLFFIRRAR